MNGGYRDPARLSLLGLSAGDAFGEACFSRDPAEVAARIEAGQIPPGSLRWTDDTAMAVSVVETLEARGRIDPEDLARRFAFRYAEDPARGYGGGAHTILSAIARGEDWRTVSRAAFGGTGSWGNGGAMRAAPIGAWYAGDPVRAAAEGAASAEPTHAHPEGADGAAAVAAAASVAAGSRQEGASPLDGDSFFSAVLDVLGSGRVREGIEKARTLGELPALRAAWTLGSGMAVAAFDTVPFCLWVAARQHADFASALRDAAAGIDRDTTCAIVGGIVALSAPGGVPAAWVLASEPLPGFEYSRGQGPNQIILSRNVDY
jgi:ADP-ribosylglycohydrolase